MPFDGSGNYAVLGSPTFPAVAGNVVKSSYFNAIVNDLATALSNVLCRDGQSTVTADLSLNSHKLTNVSDPVSSQDAVTIHYLTNTLAFAAAVTSPAARLALTKLKDYPTPKDGSGISLDNISDDTAGLNAYLNDSLVTYSDGLNLPSKTTGAVTINRSDLTLRNWKLKPNTSANINTVQFGPTSADGSTVLSVNAAEGAYSITVVSTAAAAVGKLCVITFSNPLWVAYSANAGNYQFVSRVVSVGVLGAGVVELADNLPDAIQSAWTHTVAFWTPATELDIEAALDMATCGTKQTITAISKSNPARLTIPSHGIPNGKVISINGPNTSGTSTGMFEIHGALGAATVIDANTVSIPVDSTTYSTYTGGAVVREVVQGFYISCVDRSRFKLTAKNNDGSGWGICIGIAYDSSFELETTNCGNQDYAGIHGLAATNCSMTVRSDNASGFATMLSGLHYCSVWDKGSSRAGTGRGSKFVRGRYNTVNGSFVTNSELTSLAVAWALRDVTFIGYNVIGSSRTSAQNGGVWTDGCYNTGLKFIGCRVKNNLSFDVQVNINDEIYLTDCDIGTLSIQPGGTAHRIGGKVTTLSSAGTYKLLAEDGLTVSGNNVAVFTDTIAGFPVVLNAGGPNAYPGANVAGDFQIFTDRVVFQAKRGAPTSGQTAIVVTYHNGTAVTAQTVSLGAADSAGTGFKTLRVPN